jgi:hypothetical protein
MIELIFDTALRYLWIAISAVFSNWRMQAGVGRLPDESCDSCAFCVNGFLGTSSYCANTQSEHAHSVSGSDWCHMYIKRYPLDARRQKDVSK